MRPMTCRHQTAPFSPEATLQFLSQNNQFSKYYSLFGAGGAWQFFLRASPVVTNKATAAG